MNFKEQWDRMTVVERIAHIRADWQSCLQTHDPLVLRIASTVAHDVCLQAADEIERLRAQRDEARRGLCYEVAAWVADFKHSTHEAESRAEAERRGWDCFKEER